MINIEQLDNKLLISKINKKGDVDFVEVNIPDSEYYEWVYTKPSLGEPNVLSWDDKYIRKSPTKRLNRYRIMEFLSSLSQSKQNEIFEYNTPKMYFCDIEVDCEDEFWKPENPQGAVTTIALASEKNNVMVLSTKNLSKIEQDNIQNEINEHFKILNVEVGFKFICFKSEYDMLTKFFHKVIINYPLLTGWNFLDYDWTYLLNRAKLLGINPEYSSYSSKLTGRYQVPLHKIVVDYLEIYKKWDRTIDVKESNTLDFVSKECLGTKKLSYPGTLSDLYNNNFKDYVKYNAIDALLVRFIHQKINTVTSYLKLSYLTKVDHANAFSPVRMTENMMIPLLMKQNKYFVLSEKDGVTQSGYQGAFVMNPIKGFHEFLAIFDYSSLYPTTMRQWNISPEKFIKVDKDFDIKGTNFIKASSGAIFKNDSDGILRILLEDMYAKRKTAQTKAKNIEKEIAQLKEFLVK